MIEDQFALEHFRRNYGHYFTEIKVHKSANGASEIVGFYNKPRFKRDWIPNSFCRRPVRCVRIADEQTAQQTPPPKGA